MAFFDGPIAKPNHDPAKPGPIKAKWEFSQDELMRSPSVLAGMPYTEEQRLIMHGATFVRKIADRLNEAQKELPKITQLSVSVSIIQLRRFFTVHALKDFDARDVGAAILFMTSKSEDCPRRLDYFVRAWFRIRYESENKNFDPKEQVSISKETCKTFGEYIVWLENIALQTLGFNLNIEVPHPLVLNLAAKYKSTDKKFTESVFWMVTDVLHLTNWTLTCKTQKLAAACFYMATIWKDENPKFPQGPDDQPWFKKSDPTLTLEQLQDMTRDFLFIWKNVDRNAHLSMSQFDHKTPPIILDQASSNNRNQTSWRL